MKKPVLSIIALILIGAPWSEAKAQTQSADKQLYAVCQKTVEDYAVFIASLEETPSCRIMFCDVQLKMKVPYREPGYYRSKLPVCEAIYFAELTQDKIKTLQRWTVGVEKGYACAGKVKVQK